MNVQTDLNALRETYTALREAQRALNRKLMTMLPKQALPESARTLGFWRHGGILVDHEDHFAVITDYAVYDYRLRRGTNAVERLWKQRTEEGTPTHLVLEAMQDARFTVLRVVEAVPETGALVDDLLYGGQYFLADILLSENAEKGITIGTRVLTFPGFLMTTGASFPIDPEPVERIATLLKDESASGRERIRKLVAKDKSWLTALIIGLALAPAEDEDEDYDEDGHE